MSEFSAMRGGDALFPNDFGEDLLKMTTVYLSCTSVTIVTEWHSWTMSKEVF